MEFNDFIKLLGRKKQTIVTIILVATMMTVLLSLLSPLKYELKSRLLISQDSGVSDVYALSRSNEYLGRLLSEVVYSGSFYDRVLSSNFNVDKTYFKGDYSKQIKRWQRTVSTKTRQDTGIIEISVYHPSVPEARKIALAINHILINNSQDYHGGGSVKISIIDQPLASDYPVSPNVLMNALFAAGLAFLFSLFFIYIFPEDKYSIYLFGSASLRTRDKKSRKVAKSKETRELPAEIRAFNESQVIPEKREEGGHATDDIDLSGNIDNLMR